MKRFIIGFLCSVFILPLVIGVTPSLQWGDTPLKTNLPPVVITGRSTFKIIESRQIPIPSAVLPGGKERPEISVSVVSSPNMGDEGKPKPTPKSPGCTYRNAVTTKIATIFKGDKAYDQRGKYLLLNRRFHEAIEAFQTLIGTYPESPLVGEAYFWIGECYFQLNDLYQAEQHYKVTVQKYPSSLYADYAIYSIGWISYKKKAFSKAIKYFKRGTLSYPNSSILFHMLFWLAESYMQNNETDSAFNVFMKLLKKSPPISLKIPALFEVAKIKFLRKEYLASKRTFQNLLSTKPPKPLVPKIYLMIGWCEYFLKDPNGLVTFKTLLKLPGLAVPIMNEAIYGKCMCAIQQGKPEIAIKIVDTLGPDFPWYGEVIIGLATYYYNENDYKKAEAFSAKIFQNFPKTPFLEKAYMILGNSSYNSKDFSHATEYYTRVILGKVETLKPMAIFAKGLSFYQMGMFRDAIDSWEMLIKKYNNFARKDEALYWLGSAYLNLHREKIAEGKFDQLKGNNQIYPNALIQLAQYWFGQQSWKKALGTLRRFLKLYPQHPFAGFAKGMVGEIYFNLKSYKKAFFWLEKAIKDPTTKNDKELVAKLMFIMGQISYRQGNYGKATSYFNYVATRLPKNAFSDDALYWKATSYYSNQLYKKAIGDLKLLINKYPESPLVPNAYLKIADCYYNLKNYSLSDAYYKKAATLFKKGKIPLKAAYGRVLSLYQQGKYKRFYSEAKRFINVYPSSALTLDVIQLLAEYYERNGAIDNEIELLENYLKRHKTSQQAEPIRLKLSKLYVKKGLYNSAIVQLRIIALRKPPGPFQSVAEKEMGDLYFEQKLYREAIIHYKKYLSFEKLSIAIEKQVKHQLIVSYIRTKRLRMAENLLGSGTKIYGPDWAAPLYAELGKTYQQRGNYKAALNSFRKAAKATNSKTKCQALVLIAESYRKIKKYDKALKTLLMVRYSYPECHIASEKALLALAIVMVKKGKKREAKQLLEMLKKSKNEKIKKRAKEALKRFH